VKKHSVLLDEQNPSIAEAAAKIFRNCYLNEMNQMQGVVSMSMKKRSQQNSTEKKATRMVVNYRNLNCCLWAMVENPLN
jgi:hypothetical protein